MEGRDGFGNDERVALLRMRLIDPIELENGLKLFRLEPGHESKQVAGASERVTCKPNRYGSVGRR